MKVGEILEKSKNRLSSYGISYRHPFDAYYDLFLSNDDIKPVQIKSVLVLTDKRPRSLVAIAYALRLTRALNANLLAITRGVHQELIKGEAEFYDINLSLLHISKQQPSLDFILRTIHQHDVGMVIFHNLYALSDELQENSPVPVLVVKIDQFFKITKDKVGGYIS
ncbi:MAG: hypothetical protein ACFE9D_04020 [Promethearchaeota archaeon]